MNPDSSRSISARESGSRLIRLAVSDEGYGYGGYPRPDISVLFCVRGSPYHWETYFTLTPDVTIAVLTSSNKAIAAESHY